MRRFVHRWLLVGLVLSIAVIVLSCTLYLGDAGRRHQQQLATEHRAVIALTGSVDDVLAREIALARVVGTLSRLNQSALARALERRDEPAAREQHGVHSAGETTRAARV